MRATQTLDDSSFGIVDLKNSKFHLTFLSFVNLMLICGYYKAERLLLHVILHARCGLTLGHTFNLRTF